jgi:hypothetical protein
MNTPCRPFALLMALSIASPVGLTSCSEFARIGPAVRDYIPERYQPFFDYAYAINQQQLAQAESTANRSLRNSEIRQKLKSTHTKYVAVPVKKDRRNSLQSTSKAENLVVLVDAETGKAKGNAFEPTKSSYRKGEEISVSGTKAIVGTSFSGI